MGCKPIELLAHLPLLLIEPYSPPSQPFLSPDSKLPIPFAGNKGVHPLVLLPVLTERPVARRMGGSADGAGGKVAVRKALVGVVEPIENELEI